MKTITKAFVQRYAKQNVGGFSNASKMPCFSWSISTDLCQMGGLLRNVKGSVCSKCYADRGNYNWPNVMKAHQRRIDIYRDDPIVWRDSMLVALKYLHRLGETHFRWFDSGDIQSVEMLRHFMWICERSALKFWLPTKEAAYVRTYLDEGGTIPGNTIIRLSAPMIGSSNAPTINHPQVQYAFVDVQGTGINQCPASQQDNQCLDCRTCWETKPVSYKEI